MRRVHLLAIGGAALLMLPAAAAMLAPHMWAPSNAIDTGRIAQVAGRHQSFSAEQRLAVAAEIQAQLHPAAKDLSWSARATRFALLAQRLLLTKDAVATPAANFVGNQTIISNVSGDLIALQRQSDCSLSRYDGSYTLSTTMNPTVQFTQAIPGYEKTLHSAAALTTTSNVFAGGCNDPSVGLGTRRGAYLGRTPQGMDMEVWRGYSASQSINQLLYATIDPATMAVQASSADSSVPGVTAITVGDLNGDGLADVVGINSAAATIDVWLANGNGTLSAPVAYALTGTTTEAAVIADVTGDGKADVIVVTRDATSGQEEVSVLAGKGDGTLAAPQTFNIPSLVGGVNATPVPLANLIAVDLR